MQRRRTPTSSAATSTPSVVDDFFGALFSRITQWFADASNGIKTFIAENIIGKKVTTDELCVKDVCVNRDQLAAVLAGSGAAAPPAPSSTTTATSSPTPTTSTTTTTSGAVTAPAISINGNNPAHITVGDTYADLGATITGPQSDLNLGIRTFLNGTLVSTILLDTTQAATDTIDYVATDSAGLTATSTRIVLIEAAPSTSAATTDLSADSASTTATSTVQ